mmetsp:Transcript_23096/g.68645  ORF Transcript_23096/g.68645 Transcript_23096/m.68645 type:complete len:212 (-) Transcript_23096:5130-5765(-)
MTSAHASRARWRARLTRRRSWRCCGQRARLRATASPRWSVPSARRRGGCGRARAAAAPVGPAGRAATAHWARSAPKSTSRRSASHRAPTFARTSPSVCRPAAPRPHTRATTSCTSRTPSPSRLRPARSCVRSMSCPSGRRTRSRAWTRSTACSRRCATPRSSRARTCSSARPRAPARPTSRCSPSCTSWGCTAAQMAPLTRPSSRLCTWRR